MSQSSKNDECRVENGTGCEGKRAEDRKSERVREREKEREA